MKIVYLVYDCNSPTGGLRVIFEHANRLIKRGYQVEIWYENWFRQPLPFPCLVPLRCLHEIDSPKTDIFIITDPSYDPGYLPRIFNQVSAKKYFCLVQHNLELIEELLEARDMAVGRKEIFSHFPDNCQVLSVSSWVKERLQSQYQLSSTLIVNGVNFDLFHPSQPLLKFNEPALLFFYDPQNWKGFDDVCRAINFVKTKIMNLQVIMVGRYLPKFDVAEGTLGSFVWPVIFFNGPFQQDLAKIYSSASVFVSSSWAEGFGLPGLEAMACGVPVVTTDSGGVREYAIPEETAIVVPPRNPESLAEGILRVLKDKSLSQKLIQNGLRKAKEFDWEKSIDKLERVFRE